MPRIVDRLADLLADEGDEGVDVAVAGRARDLAMEGKVGLDAALLPALLAAHAVERRLDRGEVALAAPRRGKRCADSVSSMRRSSNRCSMFCAALQRLAVDADRQPLLRRQHEGADALARLDHAVGAQLRDRLAHHVAADAEFFRELLLGRQPAPGLKSPDSISRLSTAATRCGKASTTPIIGERCFMAFPLLAETDSRGS